MKKINYKLNNKNIEKKEKKEKNKNINNFEKIIKIKNCNKNYYFNKKCENLNSITNISLGNNNYINQILLLFDGRIAVSIFNKIQIYNKISLELEIIIAEHLNEINYIYQLNDEKLISCSQDNSIKFFSLKNSKEIKKIKNEKIKKNLDYVDLYRNLFLNYSLLNTIEYSSSIWKIIQSNYDKNILFSCTKDYKINIHKKNKNKITKYLIFPDNLKYKIYYNNYYKNIDLFDEGIVDILEIKENILASYLYNKSTIIFWNIKEKEEIKKIGFIECSLSNKILTKFENILIIGGKYIYLINIDNYELINSIKISFYISCILPLEKEKVFLTGDNNGNLIQWKYENKNISLYSKKEKIHNKFIISLSKYDNNKIISCSNEIDILTIWE